MQKHDEKKVAQAGQPMPPPVPAPVAQKDEAPMLPFAGQEEVPLAVDDDPMLAQAPMPPPAPMPAPTAQAPLPPPIQPSAQAMPPAPMPAPTAQAPAMPMPGAPVTADDALQQYK